jgi:hypothetical protein
MDLSKNRLVYKCIGRGAMGCARKTCPHYPLNHREKDCGPGACAHTDTVFCSWVEASKEDFIEQEGLLDKEGNSRESSKDKVL